MPSRFSSSIIFAIIITFVFEFSKEARAEDKPELQPLHVMAAWEAGEIEQGFYYGESRNVDRELINRAVVWTLEELRLNDHARAFMGVGGGYFFVFPRNLGRNPYSMSKRSGFGLTDAHGEFEFFQGEHGDHGLLAKAGVFQFKYDEDAKNLGEYMYRTWTYPTIITTGTGLSLVNGAGVQLSGADVETREGGFRNDVLLTIQSDRAPIFGLSLADIASYRFGILTVGGGFMFDNFYNPDPEQVQPKGIVGNEYFTLSDGTQMAAREYADLQSQNLIPAGVTVNDTGYYTFAGQKAMARASLDIGKATGSSLLSPEDLRVYFEAILMGVKNYPTFYEKTLDRTAFMFGVNLPTFRLADLLSFEAEYCANPFENSMRGPYGDGLAVPHVDDPPNAEFPNLKRISADNWKWTLYLKKQVYPGFAVHVQAASDHLRQLDVYSTPDFYDFLQRPSHWYWVVNFAYSI